MPRPTETIKANGIVILLDALGVRSHHIEDAENFLRQRDAFQLLFSDKFQEMDGQIDSDRLHSFLFGDTILLAYRSNSRSVFKDVRNLLVVMRKVLAHSMKHGPLLRGSMATGDFLINEESNTAIGPAVSDAAEWFEAADWMGLCLTPRTSLYFKSQCTETKTYKYVAIEYPVPLVSKDTSSDRQKDIPLIVCNWPKALRVRSISPVPAGHNEKSWLLESLSKWHIPRQSERKYRNTIAFYEHASAISDD